MLDSKMAVQNVALLVFLFPVVISMAFGVFVLSDALTQPDRELNMWQFGEFKLPTQTGNKEIQIQGLLKEYSASMPIEVKISVSNPEFDCGDLYITIYDTKSSPKQVILQNGFFSQCFLEGNLALPVDDTFSEKIDTPGEYEIVVEMNDKNYEKGITTTAKFKVQ
ncbi:MAG: hypothetical protein ACREAG_05465 [Nitrosopumilaceae archaeon]